MSAYAQVSIAVGALNKFDGLAEAESLNGRYSNIGPNLDLVAYGGDANKSGEGDIRTIDRIGANGYSNGDYTDAFSGTSAACPQVSGVAALILSINPNLTRQEVENILFTTAVDLGGSGRDDSYGHGKVNAFASVKSALATLGETFYESSGRLAKTKIHDNRQIIFTGKPSCSIASGSYFCDVYRVQADASSELDYVRFGGDGLSGANPNNGEYWVNTFLNEDIPGNSPPVTSVQTFYYFIRNDAGGKSINKWVPTNPDNAWATTYYLNPPENINTNQIIESGQVVNIYATNSITLGTNFHAKNGSSVLVKPTILPVDIVCLPNPTGNIVVPPNGGRLSGSSLTDKQILFSSSSNETSNTSLTIENIVIYPNPTHGNFIVHIPKTDFSHANIEIQDIRGVSVFTSAIYTFNQNISFTKNSGIYIVKVTIDNVIYSKRIVLK